MSTSPRRLGPSRPLPCCPVPGAVAARISQDVVDSCSLLAPRATAGVTSMYRYIQAVGCGFIQHVPALPSLAPMDQDYNAQVLAPPFMMQGVISKVARRWIL